ncbi:MAG: FtsX-like permease family protein [Thermoplasmata archaeon]|nr:FtsX-like permease family protein [Thermoplasmata archaeon]
MINESSHPTTFNLIKSNLRNKNKQIHILIFCLSICVFVQSLLIGLSVGIENELAQRPEIFDNGVNFFEAVGGWTRTLFGIVSLIIVVTLFTQILRDISERRKDMGIYRAIGLKRKHFLHLTLAEHLIPASVSFLIGTVLSILVGLIMDINFNHEIGIFASPFSVTVWMLSPLLVIFISTIIISNITFYFFWHLPIEEVLKYE